MIAVSRYVTCDYCGESENAVFTEEWTDERGHHVVHSGEIQDYLADLRDESDTRRLNDGTLVV